MITKKENVVICDRQGSGTGVKWKLSSITSRCSGAQPSFLFPRSCAYSFACLTLARNPYLESMELPCEQSPSTFLDKSGRGMSAESLPLSRLFQERSKRLCYQGSVEQASSFQALSTTTQEASKFPLAHLLRNIHLNIGTSEEKRGF